MRDVADEREHGHRDASCRYVRRGEMLVAGNRQARSEGSERQEERFVEAHMTLWPYAPEFSNGFERLWLNTDSKGLFLAVEISEDDEHLMSPIIRVRPALTDSRVKEV
jgi:hypothetical protein